MKKKVPNRIYTDAFREIKKTRSRFLSLFLLSALAVAFLAGLRTTAPDMEYTADDYYDRTHLMDVRVLSTLGLTDDDIAALAAAPGVEKAEGAWYVDTAIHSEHNDLIVRFHSLSEIGINDPELLEGQMPQADDECVVEPAFLTESGLSIGDVITPDMEGTSYEGSLVRERFTIVGTVNSSLYMSRDRGTSTIGTGRLTAVAFLPREAFDLDYYTEAYLRAEGAAGIMCYDDAYQERIDALIDVLKPMGEERADFRYEEVVGEATDKLNEAQQEYDDAEAEAEQELADAWQKLQEARQELDDGWKEYSDGVKTLEKETRDAKQKIADGEAELADALKKLEDGEAEYTDGLQKLDDGRAEYEEGLAEYNDALAKYQEGRQKLLDGEAEYEENRQTLLDAQKEYEEGLARYEDGMDQYRTGLAEYRDGVRQLDEARQQLDEAEVQIQAGQAELDANAQKVEAARELLPQAREAYETALKLYEAAAERVGDPETLADRLANVSDEDIAAIMEGVDALRDELQRRLDEMGPDDPGYQELLDAIAALPTEEEIRTQLAENAAEIAGRLLQGMEDAKTGLDQAGTSLNELEEQIKTYDDGAAQLEEAKMACEEGWREYNAGMAQLQGARQELDDAKAELDDAKAQIEDAKAQMDDGWRQLDEGRQTLDDGWAELNDGKAQLDDAKTQIDDAAQELADGQVQMDEARQELDDGWKEYRNGVAELEDAKATLPRETAKAQKELDDAKVKLDDGETEYADGLQEYEDGKAEAEEKLSDARRELNDARRKILEIENCTWYILGRNTNTGYVSYQQDAERMGNLAQVFPLIFFLVAALVCLTTMTRMVEEQRVQIGGLKALGYSRLAISTKYVGYGFLSSFLGGLVGLAVGCTLIPTIIFNAWKVMYTVGDLRITAFPAIYIAAVGAAVFCVTGTALAASFAALTAVPATLMRPKAPQAGKRVLLERVGFIWKRLSFTWKVTVRNLFRYKKRFLMAVIGIGGCTALLITGFGLRDSIHGFFDTQYDEITTYHGTVSLAENVTEDELKEIGRELDRQELVEAWTTMSDVSVTVESSKRAMDTYVYLCAVTDEEKFDQFIHLQDRKTGTPISLMGQGAVVTEKLAELLGVGVGDVITLVDSDNSRVQVPITAITENYIMHYIYLSHEAYLELYGEEPAVNSILVRYVEDTEANSDAVASRVLPLAGVSSVTRTDALRQSVIRGLQGVDYAVIVVVVAAAALAFVVLYNLTNINITERLRELATLKVLGFTDHEMSDYVYRENIFLTVFGILLGLVMGKYLHRWLVMTVEIDMAMFFRYAEPLSYVLAAILTVVFSFLVNIAAKRRLRKIDMVESLKTVE